MAKTRFPYVLTLLAVVLLAVLVSLGTWQVNRLQWKVGLIDAAEAAHNMPPAPLEQVLASDAPEFRQVIATCRGLNTAAFVELRTIDRGEAGVRLASACPLSDGTTIMVDRGFVRQDDTARPAVDAARSMPVTFAGVLRQPTKASGMTPAPQGLVFYGRDNEAMAKALGVTGPVSSWVLYAATAINPEVPQVHPVVPPPAFTNNHLGYALTWFGLAAALIVLYAVLLRRRLVRKADSQGQRN